MEAAKNAVGKLMGYNEGEQPTQEHTETHEQHAQQPTSHEQPATEHPHPGTEQPAQEAPPHQTPAHHQTTHPSSGDPHASEHKSHHLHNPLHHNKSGDSAASDAPSHQEKSEEEKGPDPALVGEADMRQVKLTGQAAPGSHSAVFGLTPDGHSHTDTSHGVTPMHPAHSKETSVSKKHETENNDDSSRAPTGGAVKEQMDAPDTGAKGLERKEPAPEGSGSNDGKPGAGSLGLTQGAGTVGN